MALSNREMKSRLSEETRIRGSELSRTVKFEYGTLTTGTGCARRAFTVSICWARCVTVSVGINQLGVVQAHTSFVGEYSYVSRKKIDHTNPIQKESLWVRSKLTRQKKSGKRENHAKGQNAYEGGRQCRIQVGRRYSRGKGVCSPSSHLAPTEVHTHRLDFHYYPLSLWHKLQLRKVSMYCGTRSVSNLTSGAMKEKAHQPLPEVVPSSEVETIRPPSVRLL